LTRIKKEKTKISVIRVIFRLPSVGRGGCLYNLVLAAPPIYVYEIFYHSLRLSLGLSICALYYIWRLFIFMLIDSERSIFYLTGFMGSGKSTVGGELSVCLGLQFYDLDVLIEKRAKKSIVQIFKEDGASIFRAIEAQVLKDVSQLSFCVVALGGGTIIDPENLTLVQRTGYLICLEASTDETWSRVSATERRVLLEGKKHYTNQIEFKDITKRIELLKQIREPYYDKADVFVDTTNLTVAEVVTEIMAKVEVLLEKSNSTAGSVIKLRIS